MVQNGYLLDSSCFAWACGLIGKNENHPISHNHRKWAFAHFYLSEADTHFLSFLQNVIWKYPGKTVMILDNARIHHAKLLKPFLEEYKDRLTLTYLPPYSPNLNMIEELWGWLKTSVINNVFFNTLDDIRDAVHGFISWINQNKEVVIDRLCLQYWITFLNVFRRLYRCYRPFKRRSG